MTRITIFSAPKPFDREHIALIQRNAIQSWLHLNGDEAEVEVILLGDEPGIAEIAAELGVKHIPDIERNRQGTPRLDSIFQKAEEAGSGQIMAYLNADIVALPDFVQGALAVAGQESDFLIVGQRWDLDLTRPLDFSEGWPGRLLEECKRDGRRHPRGGSDYFIFPRGKFGDLPPFALGRAGWDNWMIYAGRRRGTRVVDASGAINIIHQTHDYGHLVGGRPHYQHPESTDNLKMAGGSKVIFTLDDAGAVLEDGKVQQMHSDWRKFWREIEIAPLVGLKSDFLGELFYLVFHPIKTYRLVRGRLGKLKKRIISSN